MGRLEGERSKAASIALAVALSTLFAGIFLFAHLGLHYADDVALIAVSASILGTVGGILSGRTLARKGKLQLNGWQLVIVNLVGLVLTLAPLAPLFFEHNAPELRPLAIRLQHVLMEEMALAATLFEVAREMTYWGEIERPVASPPTDGPSQDVAKTSR